MKNFNDFKTQYANYLKDNVIYIVVIAFCLALSRSFAYGSIHLGTAGSAYALNTWIVETLQTFIWLVEFTAIFPIVCMGCDYLIKQYEYYRANEKPLEPKNEVAEAKLHDEPWNTKLVQENSENSADTTSEDTFVKFADNGHSNKGKFYIETMLPPVLKPKHKAVVFYNGQYKEFIARDGDLTIFVPDNELSEDSFNSLVDSDFTDVDLVIQKDKSSDLPDYDKLQLAGKNVKIYVHF
jgi:hypothetical protein